MTTETVSARFRSIRSYKEIALDSKTHKEDRLPAIIRQNLMDHVPNYFGGLQEGDNEKVFMVVSERTLNDQRVVTTAIMMDGDVRVGQVIAKSNGHIMADSKRITNKELLDIAARPPVFRHAFQATKLLGPLVLPPYVSPEESEKSRRAQTRIRQ